MADAQHYFCALLKDLELELSAHWRDPARARRVIDAISDAAAGMVRKELEEWRGGYDTDF